MNKDKKILAVYASDASGIKGKTIKVFFPTTIEEVQKIISENTVDIVPRGSGTNLMGGAVPNNSIIVEMRGLNKVIHVDPLKKTTLVQAGITIKELNEKLRPVNMEFPIMLNEQSTLGSMIAVNTFGNKSMRYGFMKDWIEEIEFINGKGELFKIGRADFAEVCGMEGTTGIICAARIKLLPRSKKSFSLFQSDSIDEIISLARRLKAEPEVVMLKLYSKKTSKIVGLPEKYYLIIGFDSSRGKIKENDAGKINLLLKDEYFYLYTQGYIESEDAKLFYDKFREYIMLIEEIGCPYIADAGSAIVNTFFKKEETTALKKIIEFNTKMSVKKGRYPIGLKRKYLIDPLEKKIFQRIKKRHDPQGKMNKAKLFDDFVPIPLETSLEPILNEENQKRKKEKIIPSAEITNPILQEISPQKKMPLVTQKIEYVSAPPSLKADNVEYNAIKKIMTNNEKKEAENSSASPSLVPEKKSNFSEMDLIKKIMTNQRKDENDKKEGKKNGD